MDHPPVQAHYPVQQPTTAPVISTKEWLVNILLMSIPFVGLIMLIIWACSDTENPSKRNYARARLIWAGIVLVLVIAFYLVFFVILGIFAAASSAVPPAP